MRRLLFNGFISRRNIVSDESIDHCHYPPVKTRSLQLEMSLRVMNRRGKPLHVVDAVQEGELKRKNNLDTHDQDLEGVEVAANEEMSFETLDSGALSASAQSNKRLKLDAVAAASAVPSAAETVRMVTSDEEKEVTASLKSISRVKVAKKIWGIPIPGKICF